ncbi:hypothetical protein PF011_g3915 [Phytophthora fragariae]|nr:hypothetical protein PF011_g3915 [Phytophthora fragariae]
MPWHGMAWQWLRPALSTNLATNPAVLTNTAGLVASLATGNTPGIATNAAGLTAAVTPVLVSAFTPAPASEAALAAAPAS